MQIWAANACMSLSALAASKAFDLAMIGLEQGDGVEVRGLDITRLLIG